MERTTIRFNSLNEVAKFLATTNEQNNVFVGSSYLSSKAKDYDKQKLTDNLEQALDYMKYGWEDGAKQLTEKFNNLRMKIADKKSTKAFYDVAGFQASVPRYLQGVPTSMINQKRIPKKQPVVTLIKSIGYTFDYTAETILEEGFKAIQIIEAIEASGVRVNLDVVRFTNGDWQQLETRIRIKNADERLNISKLAFAIAHPSMLRRICFAIMEKHPMVEDRSFRYDYGSSLSRYSDLQYYYNQPNEYLIPGVIDNDIQKAIKEMGLKI